MNGVAPWLIDDFIAHAPLGVGVFDRDLRFVKVNERLAEINGLPPEAHVGRRPQELLPALPEEAYLPALRRALEGEVTEAVALTGRTPADPEAERNWMESWAPVRGPDGSVVGVMVFVAEDTDRVRAEQALHSAERRARTRAEALADLAATLAAASTVDAVAAGVASRAPAAADAAFANMAVVDPEGARLHLIHNASLHGDIARRWRDVPLDAPVPIAEAARRGEAVFVSSADDYAERFPAIAEDTARAGLAATASLPLLERGGRLLGVVGFGWAEAQGFDAELRLTLRTIAELVDQSLQRARLYENEQRHREQADLLAEVSAALAASGPLGVRLQRLCDLLVPAFADLAVVRLSERNHHATAAAHSDAERPAALSALRDHQALDATGFAAELGACSSLHAPLRDRSTVMGALLLCNTHSGRRFGSQDRAFAQELGIRVGRALEAAQLAEAEHEIAAELQRRLLPAQLSAPGDVALAARYRAAHARLAVGGDWYDVVPRPDGRLVIAVGDIVGHGARAAAAMGQVRSALSALAFRSQGPAELITLLDAFAQRTPDVQFSTVCVALLDPASGQACYACAGHPPPLLLEADGSARLLEEARSPPLGVGDWPRREASLAVPPGARLVLYTDGLVERRRASIDAGLQRLLDAARRHGACPIEEFCDAVLAELVDPDVVEDDTALLCVQRGDRLDQASRGLRVATVAARLR